MLSSLLAGGCREMHIFNLHYQFIFPLNQFLYLVEEKTQIQYKKIAKIDTKPGDRHMF